MSDRGALAAAQEAERVQGSEVREETGNREQETEADKTLTPATAQERREQMEQEVAEIAEEKTGDRAQETGETKTLTPALSEGEREKTAERIRQSEALPVGLRTRLAELVLASDNAAAEQAIRAVEASLPGALRLAVSEVARPAHPAGDVFFHGDADAMSEEQAEVLARGQLARSGMLRGQRVRVGD